MMEKNQPGQKLFLEDNERDPYYAAHLGLAVKAVEDAPDEAFLGRTADVALAELEREFHLPLLKVHHGVKVKKEHKQLLPDPSIVDGMRVLVSYAFEGDDRLFRIRPTAHSSSHPLGQVADGRLHLWFRFLGSTRAEVQEKLAEELDNLDQWIGWVNQDVERHNRHVSAELRKKVAARKRTADLRDELLGGI